MRKTKTKRKTKKNRNRKHTYLTKSTRKLYSKKMRKIPKKICNFCNKIIGGGSILDFNEYIKTPPYKKIDSEEMITPPIPEMDSEEMYNKARQFVGYLNISELDTLVNMDDKKYYLLLWYFIIPKDIDVMINNNIAENVAENVAETSSHLLTLDQLLTKYETKEQTQLTDAGEIASSSHSKSSREQQIRLDKINLNILSHFNQVLFTHNTVEDFYVFSCRRYNTIYDTMYDTGSEKWVSMFYMNSYFSTTFLLKLALTFCNERRSENNFIICIKIPKGTTKGMCLIAKTKIDKRPFLAKFNSEYEFLLPPCGLLTFTEEFYKDILYNGKRIPIYNYDER